MANTFMQVYEIPVHHLTPAVSWLHNEGMQYFSRFGIQNSLLQVAGSREQLASFQLFLRELWIVRETSVFPLKHAKLVGEELDSWGIKYKRTRNPFCFEVVTEIDSRKLARFNETIRTLTKKPKRKDRQKVRAGIPNDASSLLE